MPGVSKVTLNDEVLMDVTEMTVDTDNLLQGETALRNNGDVVTGAVAIAPGSDTNPAMDGTASAGVAEKYSRGDHVHPTDTSRAAADHVHGSITNDGKITSDTAVASGDKIVITDSSASNAVKRSGIAFGANDNTFLRKDGSWGVPDGTYSLPTASAEILGGVKVGNNLSISEGVLSATDTIYEFDGTYDATTNKAATVSTVTNAINALDGGTIGTGGTTKTITNLSQTNGNVSATFDDIAFPVTSVNGETGAVVLDATDVGALPDNTPIPQGTVTSVRVQATSPVQSSTSTAQTETLNTTISLADGYGDTKNPYASKTKNTVLAAPSTANGAPSFRALTAADIPTLTKSKISDFPTDVSEFNNDAGYLTTETDPVYSASPASGITSTNISNWNAKAEVGDIPTSTSDLTNDSNFVSDANYVHTDSNFTAAEKTKLAGIAEGATVDDHKWNDVELNTGVTYMSNPKIPALSSNTSKQAFLIDVSQTPSTRAIAQYDTDSYLKSTTPAASDSSTKVATTAFVSNAVSSLGSVLNYKGTKATVAELPSTGNETGDVWIVTADSSEHVWNGSAWEKFGPTVDLSGYVPTSRTVNGKALSADISLSASDVGALPDSTDVTKWNGVELSTVVQNVNTLYYVPVKASSEVGNGTASWMKATPTPTNYAIAKYDGSSYLYSTTPAASDNSTKVATTAYVDSAVGAITVPVTSVNSKTGAVVLTAADVGALPDSTDLSGYMQKGVDYVTAGKKSGTNLGTKATAEGYNTTASGQHSHAEGYETIASGTRSHAEGQTTTASGTISHAEGSYTIANHAIQHVFGAYNIADTNPASVDYRGDYVEIVGNGTADNARSNARTLDWLGNEVLAGKLTVGAGPTNNMDVATKQYVDTAVGTVDALPSQSGQSGKFLTTNGTEASWATVTIPTYTLSISGNRITLTPSSGTASYIDLPVYNGTVV